MIYFVPWPIGYNIQHHSMGYSVMKFLKRFYNYLPSALSSCFTSYQS